jgi:phenylacetate-coenzyme A ligase PaaK-like adenylate-forming protein
VHSTGFGAATVNSPILTAISAPATLPIGELVDRLNEIQPATLQGYPAKLAELAREQLAGRLRIAPVSVTCTSEMLTEADAEEIVQGFGVPPVNQFASTEGLVGHSEPGGNVLTFASDLCIAELVDEHGDPVPPGTPSASVLVTNLHNLTQPMIRYELTDSFIEAEPDPSHGFLRAEVRGRSDEAFSYPEAQIHPLVIRSVLVRTPSIREYRVTQTARGIEVDVVADEEPDLGALEASLRQALAEAGLPDPEVAASRTPEIPRNPATGKLRRFVPL